MPATLPITVGSSDCDPGGFQARGVQAFDIDGILLTWNGETWQALTSPQTRQMQALVSGAGISVSTSRNALASDNGGTLELSAGVTYTLSDAVPLSAGVILQGPVTGSATLAVTGSATTNGGTSGITIAAGKMATVIPRASSASAYLVAVQT